MEATSRKDKRKFRRARWKALRGRIEVSRYIRRIEFTENIKRRLIEEVKDAVDAVQRVQREADTLDRHLNPKVKVKGPKIEGGGGEEAPPQEAEGHPNARPADGR